MASGFRTVRTIDLGNTRSVTIVVPWETRGQHGDVKETEAKAAFFYAFRDEVTDEQISQVNEALAALGSRAQVSREQFKSFPEALLRTKAAMRSYPKEGAGWCAWFVTGHPGMARRIEESL